MKSFYLLMILFCAACIGFKCIAVLPIQIYRTYPAYFIKHQAKLSKLWLGSQHIYMQVLVFLCLMFIPWILFKTNLQFETNYFLLFFSWALIVLFFIDLLTALLPDVLTLSVLLLGVFIQMHPSYKTVGISDALVGIVLGGGVLYLGHLLFFLIKKKEGIGFGDIKLFAMIGAWVGYKSLPLIMMIASILFLIFILLRWIKTKKLPSSFPFGPFIALGTLIAFY
jgi:prepilin signal peptidase PulO-like enzyme (type II secretory pathway)